MLIKGLIFDERLCKTIHFHEFKVIFGFGQLLKLRITMYKLF
jgi:hypothetical protein